VKSALAVALAVLGLAACRVSPPTATSADAARSNSSLAELTSGRALVVRKCGNCHRPPMPTDHTAADWPARLDEMAVRSNLDPRQRHLIEQYLVVMASR
jgi:hypothetical protein